MLLKYSDGYSMYSDTDTGVDIGRSTGRNVRTDKTEI